MKVFNKTRFKSQLKKKLLKIPETEDDFIEASHIRDWSKSTGWGVGRSTRKSEGPKTRDPPSFMGIKSADPPPGSG